MTTEVKCCSKCGETKAVSEFHRDAAAKDGLQSRCSACKSAENKAWKLANPGKAAEALRRWKKANPEKVKAEKQRYYAANPEKVAERNRRWRTSYPEACAYNSQKGGAKHRGIEWQFESFEQWRDFWRVCGYDFFEHRGSGKHGLCMARYGDEGPYSPENCYITTMAGNKIDARRNKQLKEAA